jgi:uncharacterized membrane protein
MTNLFIWILFLHWFADYICQPQYVNENKTKNWEVLVIHVFLYSLILFSGTALTAQFGINELCRFAVINFFIHYIIDCVTIYFVNKSLEEKNISLFLKIMGFDQFIHAATLIITANQLLQLP